MSHFLNKVVLLVFVSTLIVSCKSETEPEIVTVDTQINENAAKQLDPNAHYAKAEFGIEGMTCAMGCAKTIEKKLAKMEGVKSAKVDFDKRLAMVEYDDAKVTTNSLEDAVEKAGEVYEVKDMKTVNSFSSETKACAADCNKDCCKDKTEAEKMACAADCKKACCADKKA